MSRAQHHLDPASGGEVSAELRGSRKGFITPRTCCPPKVRSASSSITTRSMPSSIRPSMRQYARVTAYSDVSLT